MSETTIHSVGSSPYATHSGEEPMLGEDTVHEMLARLARGEGIRAIARELGVDCRRSNAGGGWDSGARARGGRGRVG